MLYLILAWLISDILSVGILAYCDWDTFLWSIRRIWGDKPNEVSHSTVTFWLALLAGGPVNTLLLVMHVLMPTLLGR